jgi:hypothetical protein
MEQCWWQMCSLEAASVTGHSVLIYSDLLCYAYVPLFNVMKVTEKCKSSATPMTKQQKAIGIEEKLDIINQPEILECVANICHALGLAIS